MDATRTIHHFGPNSQRQGTRATLPFVPDGPVLPCFIDPNRECDFAEQVAFILVLLLILLVVLD